MRLPFFNRFFTKNTTQASSSGSLKFNADTVKIPFKTALKALVNEMKLRGASSTSAQFGSTALVLAIAKDSYNNMSLMAAANASGENLGTELRSDIAHAFSAGYGKKFVVSDVNAPKAVVHGGHSVTKNKVTTEEAVNDLAARGPATLFKFENSGAEAMSTQPRSGVVGPSTFFGAAGQEDRKVSSQESKVPVASKGPGRNLGG